MQPVLFVVLEIAGAIEQILVIAEVQEATV